MGPNVLTFLNQFKKYSQRQLDNMPYEVLRSLVIGCIKAVAADAARADGEKGDGSDNT